MENAEFSGYYFYINTYTWGDFQIFIGVPLRYQFLNRGLLVQSCLCELIIFPIFLLSNKYIKTLGSEGPVNVSRAADAIRWGMVFFNLHLRGMKCSVYLTNLFFLLTRSSH